VLSKWRNKDHHVIWTQFGAIQLRTDKVVRYSMKAKQNITSRTWAVNKRANMYDTRSMRSETTEKRPSVGPHIAFNCTWNYLPNGSPKLRIYLRRKDISISTLIMIQWNGGKVYIQNACENIFFKKSTWKLRNICQDRRIINMNLRSRAVRWIQLTQDTMGGFGSKGNGHPITGHQGPRGGVEV
jgi:hypothetical protein